ncbi:MAG: hypothetical protein KDA87_01625 [Planctomycetales bacterium]|nr:hypothetical protein [Planctomycetales bacterium]
MNTEERVSILLHVLGEDVAGPVLDDMDANRVNRIRKQMTELGKAPPTLGEINEVIAEFERCLRLTGLAGIDFDLNEGESKNGKQECDDPASLPTDPLAALSHISAERLGIGLRGEQPKTIAIVLNSLSVDQAGEVLTSLTGEIRGKVLSELKTMPVLPKATLQRILQAAIDKAMAVDLESVRAANVDRGSQIAGMLRKLPRKDRGQMLEQMSEDDPETYSQVVGKLYSISDVANLEDFSVRKLLAVLTTQVLAVVLSVADQPVADKFLANMAKRVREALEEEIEFLGKVPEEELASSNREVIEKMVELDQKGELVFLEPATTA